MSFWFSKKNWCKKNLVFSWAAMRNAFERHESYRNVSIKWLESVLHGSSQMDPVPRETTANGKYGIPSLYFAFGGSALLGLRLRTDNNWASLIHIPHCLTPEQVFFEGADSVCAHLGLALNPFVSCTMIAPRCRWLSCPGSIYALLVASC